MAANIFRRLSISLICAALLLSSLAGCAGDTSKPAETPVTLDTPSDTDTSTETTKLSDGLPNQNFEGYNFRIISAIFYSREMANYLTYEELTGNPVDDELYNSRLAIEDRFNVKISIIPTGSDTGVLGTTVKNAVFAGDDAFDIQIGHDTTTVGLAKEGCFYNMYNVSQFNFDMPWWPSNTCENLSMCGQLYVASNYMSYCGLHWTRAICVNKTYAEEHNREIPYDLVREGKWTLEAMFDFIADTSEDLDGNGKINAKDRVGFATGGQTWYCMQEALDCGVYSKDPNDYLFLDIDLERLSSMVDKLTWLVKTSGEYLNEGDFAVTTFANNRALLAYTQIGDAYDTYRESDVVYGFLPTPKLDENQENYINCCTDVPWAIPKTTPNIDIVGTICEAMSCYNYNNVLPAYFEVAMKSRTADSPEDAEMLQLIADTRTIGTAYAYGLTFNNIISDVVGTNNEISSYMTKQEKAASKLLDKLLITFEDMS